MKNTQKLFLIFFLVFMVLSLGIKEASAQACVTGRIDRSHGGDPIDMLMDVHVVGNRAFAVDRWHTWRFSDTFHTIDISNPVVPVRVAGCNLPNWSYDLDISGNYAYVVGSSGFYVVDITNPDAPNCGYASCPACITDNDIDQKKSIHISGNYAYVTDSDDGLKVVNISNPSAPFLAWSYNSANSYFDHVYVSGNYAYVVGSIGGMDGLHAININTHVLDWNVAVLNVLFGSVSVSADGNHAYVAGSGSFNVIDINSHSVVGSCDNGAGEGYDIHVVGNEVYVAGFRCTGSECAVTSLDLYRVDVSNPTAPFLNGACNSVSGRDEVGYGVFVSGANAYVADGLGGLLVIGTAGLTVPCNWQDDSCGSHGCAGQMGQSCQAPGCVNSMGICTFPSTNCKVDPSCDDISPAITDLELIDQGDGDTYRGGITTFESLGNISINAEVMDNVGGSGVKNITICWKIGGTQDCDTSPDFPVGSFNASWSRSINLSAHSGATIKYWAKATDYGAPLNTAYSPDWGNPGTDGWYMKVKADITCPLAFFQYKHIPNSLFYQSSSATEKLNHTFIFPAKSDDSSYHITKMQSGIQSSDASNWRWLYSYKINNGANINVDGNLESGAGNFTKTWTGDFSTSKNEKLKVKFSYGAFPGGVKRASNMLIEGSCGSCVVNGGACNAHGDCCSNHCQDNICCDDYLGGHATECCINDSDCSGVDVCLNSCTLTDHFCSIADGLYYCDIDSQYCNAGDTCSGASCAAGNCDTNQCRSDAAYPHHLCSMQCDDWGNCVNWVDSTCIDHCANGAQDATCGETGPDCGGPCPNPCCTQTCFTGPDCSTVPITNATTTTDFDCCGLGESCYECSPGYSWDGANCTALCFWQDDGCGAHGCNPSTERGEFCGPAGCSGGECNPAITPTQCVPDATCAPLCFWQDDGCGAHGCNPSTERGKSCGPAGCSGGACNPVITPTKCVGDPNCDCDSDPNFCETGAICPGFVCNGHTCWDIGAGESSVNTCCGDSGDPGETYVWFNSSIGCDAANDITQPLCVGKITDTSDDACCDNNRDCVLGGVCYSHGDALDIDGDGVLGEICSAMADRMWSDCDNSIGDCTSFMPYNWAQGGESAQFGEYDSGNSIECCGDDANEFLATQGPGIAAHGSKCCNSALNHGLVGDTGSCIECIANGASDWGNPTWCCSNYSQGGICCKSGTCCTDDSACGSNSCSDNCNYTHPYCDTMSGDYNCKSSNESCGAGTHCVGGATPCAPATEICGNDDDEDCDGIALPCCYWQDDGCGKHGCNIWTERGEICMPDQCTGGDNCFGQPPRCVADDLCSTFGLPDRTIMEILLDVVDWLLGIIAALAFLMIVIGGVVYLSSSGDVTRIETAKKIVTYAIVGLIIAGVSYTVIHVVFDVLQ